MCIPQLLETERPFWIYSWLSCSRTLNLKIMAKAKTLRRGRARARRVLIKEKAKKKAKNHGRLLLLPPSLPGYSYSFHSDDFGKMLILVLTLNLLTTLVHSPSTKPSRHKYTLNATSAYIQQHLGGVCICWLTSPCSPCSQIRNS